jgi:stage III sporulation protein AG
VVVSLKCGYRAIYATDSQSGANSSKHETVIVGNGSSQKALLIGYENPEIAGIGIVCSGGDDARVREQIVSIVSSAFNIPTNKIFVSGS